MKKVALGILALLGPACVVVHERRTSPPPPARVAVVYHATWHDTRHVIWREYYGCDDYDIYYCESLYGYDDDDLMFCLYVSRARRVHIRTVMFEYDRCGRDLWSVALAFGCTGDEFYVHGVEPGYAPPPYGRAYGYYWKRERGYRLTRDECHALVHLRIGVEYYGYKPHDYLREHERGVQQGRPHVFKEVAVRDYQKAGVGGKNVHQVSVQKAPDRPWEAKSRNDWENQRAAAMERAKQQEAREGGVKRSDAAEKARQQFEGEEKARKARVEADQRKAADEAARRKQEEDQKRAQDAERARRTPEEPKRTEGRKVEDVKRGDDGQKAADEQKRRADEQKRADDARKADEARRSAEDRKKAEDAQRRADEQKRADEAKRRTEEDQRKRAEEDQRRKKQEEEQKKQGEKKQEDKKK